MAKRKRLNLVEVSWVDADHEAGWVDDKTLDDREECGQAYGLLVKKTPSFVFLAQQYNSGDWLGMFRIPAGMVRGIRVIETYKLD
ncbi:MAG: hypothetical protein ACYDHM_02330 [Acidiferrobacterales bacterium]